MSNRPIRKYRYWFNIVEAKRKSCPSCKTKKKDMTDQNIYSVGYYERARLRNCCGWERLCEKCMRRMVDDLVNLHRDTYSLSIVEFTGSVPAAARKVLVALRLQGINVED